MPMLIIWAIMTLVSFLLQPKPKNAVAQTMTTPTTEEGMRLPLLFGRRWIKSPTVLWAGDKATAPIKNKGGK